MTQSPSKPPSKTPLAGGFLLAISLIVGVFAGIVRGEASFGFIIGLGVGLVLLTAVWLVDRMRVGR